MTAATEPTRRKRSLWWRLIRYTGYLLLLLVSLSVVLGGVYTVRELIGQWQFVRLVTELKKQGIPTTADDLVAIHEATTSAQNTEAWVDLMRQVTSSEYKELASGLPHVDKSWDEYEGLDQFDTSATWQDATASIHFVEQHQELIRRIHELSAAEDLVRLPIKFEGIATELASVTDTLELCRLLVLDAQVAIHLRESQRAQNDLTAIYRIVKYVDATPAWFAHWYSRIIRKEAIFIAQKGLQSNLYSDNQLAELDAIFSEYCMIGNQWRQCHHHEIGNVIPHFMNPAWPQNPGSKYPIRGHDGLFLISLYVELAEIPTDDLKQFFEAIQAKMPSVIARFRSWEAPIDLRISNAILEPMEGLATSFINVAQLHRQVRHGIALRRYQYQHGMFPNSLAELPAFESSMLAYGETPFGYGRTENGVVLWGALVDMRKQLISPTLPVTDDGSEEADGIRPYVWYLEASPAR